MKKLLMIMLALLLLAGCQADVGDESDTSLPDDTLTAAQADNETSETDPTDLGETDEAVPDATEESTADTTNDATAYPYEVDLGEPGDEGYTLDEILWEGDGLKLAVRDGSAGLYTADRRLYQQLCPMENTVFVPDKSGWREREDRKNGGFIREGLRFVFSTALAEGGDMITEYNCTAYGWDTFFTAEIPNEDQVNWYFFEHDGELLFARFPEQFITTGISTYHSAYEPETQPSILISVNDELWLRDGEWFVYDPRSGSKTPISYLKSSVVGVDPVVDNDWNELGYVVKDGSGLCAYYDIASEAFLTDYEWDSIYGWAFDGTYLCVGRNEDYDLVGRDSTWGMLNIKTGEVIGFDRPYGLWSIDLISGGGSVYFRGSDHYAASVGYVWLYTEDMKLISEEQFTQASVTGEGELIAVPRTDDLKAGHFVMYDRNGELLKTSGEYDEVLEVMGDYIVAAKDGRLVVLDADENVLVEFGEWNENMFAHTMLSGMKKRLPAQTDAEDPFKYYYFERNEDGEYIEMETDTYPAGLYFLTEDNGVEYGQKGHAKEYFWDPESGLVGKLEWGAVGGYAKPVLYLYPTEETDVTVTVDAPQLLTTVYPKYDNGWKVSAAPDGTLTDENGRNYYALYWEESGYTPVDFTEGFCVAKDDAVDFLEEKLDMLGLTNREANEMIMYWLSEFEKNEYTLVYFETTESREQYNGLNITPEPDSLLRIAIHIRAADEYTEMKEQDLPEFDREGFTAVEWGGVIHRLCVE